MSEPTFYFQGVSPAYDLGPADDRDPATAVLLGHTGTLMTDGHGNGDTDRTIVRGTHTVEVGPDTSAAAINPHLDPDLDPAALPDSYVAAPVYDSPIY